MLDQVEIFHGLSRDELARVSRIRAVRKLPQNTVVIQENEPANALYVIESGRVKVYCSARTVKSSS